MVTSVCQLFLEHSYLALNTRNSYSVLSIFTCWDLMVSHIKDNHFFPQSPIFYFSELQSIIHKPLPRWSQTPTARPARSRCTLFYCYHRDVSAMTLHIVTRTLGKILFQSSEGLLSLFCCEERAYSQPQCPVTPFQRPDVLANRSPTLCVLQASLLF